MRVALAAEGTRGDIFPMLALGECMLRLGHEVKLCGPPDFREEAERRGLGFTPVGVNVQDWLTRQAHAVTNGAVATLRESRQYFLNSIEAQFDALPDAVEGMDLVVGAGVQMAARSATELHDIPYRYVVYSPILLPSAEHAPALLPYQSMPRWANRLAWATLFPAFERLLLLVINRQRRRLGMSPARGALRHLLGERPILASDPGLAPVPPDSRLAADSMPCLHPWQPEPLPEKLDAFLAAGPPPVYVGFGSMTDPAAAETTHKLLDAVFASGCRAVLSRGWAGLGDGPLPSNVFACGAVSHASLFSRCAAVVHHGGAGTTATAARAGVPQIIVPHLLDQFYYARRIERLGLGVSQFARRGLQPAPLANAITAVVDNEIVAERARELGAELRAQADIEPGVRRMLAQGRR